MTIAWQQFNGGAVIDADISDTIVGLNSSNQNRRFNSASWLFVINNLSDLDDPAAAFNNISPLTTNGDLLTMIAGVNARLAVGTNGQVMAVNAGAPAWIANPAALKAANLSDVASAVEAFDNIAPTTTLGDIIYRGASDNVRLAIGATNTVLSVVAGAPAWTNAPTFTQLKLVPANALTAHVGGGQGSALQLTAAMNRVTTVASAGDSVKLPSATAGAMIVVCNAAAANAMDCFPASGQVINALTADAALSIEADSTVMFVCMVNGTWNAIVSAAA